MTPVTVDTMVEQALTRVSDVTNEYPSTRGPMYRRIGIRQRQIFVRAAQVNPDYYGADVLVTFAGGAADLSGLTDVPELLQRIEIVDPGTSSYAVGREVSIVSLTDPEGELPPRMTFRQFSLRQVGTDLAGVASLRIWYAHLSAPIAVDDDGSTLLDLEQPWDALLEVDLAAWIVGKATALGADVRSAALAMFAAEGTQLMAEFEAHLRTVTPTVQRFLSPLARPGSVI